MRLARESIGARRRCVTIRLVRHMSCTPHLGETSPRKMEVGR